MTFLTVSTIPPKLDVPIIARSDNEFDYGATHKCFKFNSKKWTKDEAAMHLENFGFIEWAEITNE